MSRDWAKGSSRKWRKLRADILFANKMENGGKCTLLVPGVCTGIAEEVHHIKGKAVTGDDPKYLAPACAACNRHIGSPARHQARPKRVSNW